MWQKWSDPFGLDDDFDLDNDQSEEYEDFSGEYEDSFEKIDQEEIQNNMKNFLNQKKFKGKIKVIATPMGIIPLNDNTASNKIFNFWMGHTNFDLTYNIARAIELTDGVETLDIFTRYRFRVGIGKAFEDSIVMRNINQRVYAELTNV
jgi:hypothetical protein